MKKFSKTWLLPLAIMGVAFLLAGGCKEDEDEVDVPQMTTSAVYKIMDNSAMCEYNIYTNAGFHVTEQGICWSTDPNPTTGNFKMPNGEGIGTCECCMEDLLPNTTYYVRAYAVNENGTGYGNEMVFTTPPNLTDIDGNVYHTALIGDQVWMAENLRVKHYRNGETIPEVLDYTEWMNLTTGACCAATVNWYDFYGYFYNVYAALDSRNLAPQGWHVPSDAEWKILEGTADSDYPVGDAEWDKVGWRGSDAGGNLKAIAGNWNPPNKGATDKFGFAALAAGARDPGTGNFYYETWNAVFLTSTEVGPSLAWGRALQCDSTMIQRLGGDKHYGGSVRCVKD